MNDILKTGLVVGGVTLATIVSGQSNDTIGVCPTNMVETQFVAADSITTGIKFTNSQADSLWAFATTSPLVNMYGTGIDKVTVQIPKKPGVDVSANAYIAANVVVEVKGSLKELVNGGAPWFLIQTYASSSNIGRDELASLKKQYDTQDHNQFGKRIALELSHNAYSGYGGDILLPIFRKKGKDKQTPVYFALGARVLGEEISTDKQVLEPVLVDSKTLGDGWTTKHFDQTTTETFSRPAAYLGARVRLSHDLLLNAGFIVNVTQDGSVTVRTQSIYNNYGTHVGDGPEDPNPRTTRSQQKYSIGKSISVGLTYETGWNIGPFKNLSATFNVAIPDINKLNKSYAGVGIGFSLSDYRPQICKAEPRGKK